jgi:hypothetical protein
MIYYTVKFNDGEIFADNIPTKEEAMNIRSENNFRFISRSLHVYETCYSKSTKFHSTKRIV